MSATVFLADSGTGIWISFLDLPLFPDRSSSFIPCSYLSLSILLLMLTMPVTLRIKAQLVLDHSTVLCFLGKGRGIIH